MVDQDGIDYTTFFDFFRDRYMWMGPDVDLSFLNEENDDPAPDVESGRTNTGEENASEVTVYDERYELTEASSKGLSLHGGESICAIEEYTVLLALGPESDGSDFRRRSKRTITLKLES